MKRAELIEGAVIFLCGAITAALSLGMPIGTFRMAGSGLFPLCLGAALMLLALFWLTNLLLRQGVAGDAGESAAPPPGAAGQMLRFFGASALAVLVLDILGYPLTALLLMLAMLRILGLRRPLLLVTLPLLAAAGSYLIFVQLLKIPLPKGLIGL
ncbi:MAG: tripartite tricarboxylate transporter TctB family protein [Syntrophales bacterium]